MSLQLRRRLAKHNAGKSLHKAKFRPRIRQKTPSSCFGAHYIRPDWF
jgi:hypothetical protein